MRRLVLSISILLGAACTPGSGEYGSCNTGADCQVNLQCEPTQGVTANDGGFPVAADGGGICRYRCQIQNDCGGGEICNLSLQLCSKDGGY